MTKDEALKLALEVLEGLHRDPKGWWNFHVEITAIKKALAQPKPDLTEQQRESYQKGHNDGVAHHKQAVKAAQPEQEPVATVTSETGNPDVTMSWWHEPALPVGTKLYTTPPQREWVGLTYEDMVKLQKDLYDAKGESVLPTTFAMAVEAKLRSKNT